MALSGSGNGSYFDDCATATAAGVGSYDDDDEEHDDGGGCCCGGGGGGAGGGGGGGGGGDYDGYEENYFKTTNMI